MSPVTFISSSPLRHKLTCFAAQSQAGPFHTDISSTWDMERFERVLEMKYALRRLGEPDEIVGAVLYFASQLSSYTTGALLRVDGGRQWWRRPPSARRSASRRRSSPRLAGSSPARGPFPPLSAAGQPTGAARGLAGEIGARTCGRAKLHPVRSTILLGAIFGAKSSCR
ncbi:MAG TPA: SDR family oxidoreductase [Candidatus Dormibacteraeota bacterium]